jgi:hypothetical protein
MYYLVPNPLLCEFQIHMQYLLINYGINFRKVRNQTWQEWWRISRRLKKCQRPFWRRPFSGGSISRKCFYHDFSRSPRAETRREEMWLLSYTQWERFLTVSLKTGQLGDKKLMVSNIVFVIIRNIVIFLFDIFFFSFKMYIFVTSK